MASKITITGNMTRDPKTQNIGGQDVCSFSVAVRTTAKKKDGTYEVNYYDCSLWGKRAEIVQKNCTKGSKILVTGSLAQTTYDAKDGTTRTSLHINVDDFEPLDRKSNDNNNSGNNNASADFLPY